MLDSVRDIRFSTVFLVSVIVLGTLIVVWLLIPDLATGPTPVSPQPPVPPAPSQTGSGAGEGDPAPGSEIVVEVSPEDGSRTEIAASKDPSVSAEETEAALRRDKEVEVAPSSAIQTTSSQGGYFLQAGAFSRSGGAEARLSELQQLGFEARFERRSIDGKEWTRVLVGPFETRRQATEVQAKLSTAKIESFVRKID